MAELENRCTLITSDREGSDLMIREYPGVIMDKQIQRTRIGKQIIYKFSNLDYNLLEDFLSRYPPFTNRVVTN